MFFPEKFFLKIAGKLRPWSRLLAGSGSEAGYHHWPCLSTV